MRSCVLVGYESLWEVIRGILDENFVYFMEVNLVWTFQNKAGTVKSEQSCTCHNSEDTQHQYFSSTKD